MEIKYPSEGKHVVFEPSAKLRETATDSLPLMDMHLRGVSPMLVTAREATTPRKREKIAVLFMTHLSSLKLNVESQPSLGTRPFK